MNLNQLNLKNKRTTLSLAVVCIVAVKLLAPVMAFIALVAAGFGAMLTVGRLANA